ncbi:hypothetical protein EDD98_6148 [Streptomyces sp. PanSC19]|nr:hypothetical protein EDD98_6148 [Streptomyces sp. PanSC19]
MCIYGADDKGQCEIKKIVDTPGADETEPVTESGALACISATADGEQDVMLRKADGTTVNVTPEPGTRAARLAMRNGTIAWAGGADETSASPAPPIRRWHPPSVTASAPSGWTPRAPRRTW